MALLGVLVCCSFLLAAAHASHMMGGVMTFRPRGKNPDGSLKVDFKYKAAFIDQYSRDFYWYCYSGDCGSEQQHSYASVDNSTYRWYQSEGHMVRHVRNDKPFYLMDSSCCWVNANNNYGSWSLQTGVDLGTRSDTTKPNHSPVTTILPVIRVPRNCPSSYKLMAHDPDGDTVQCRYGYYYTGECGTCNWHSQLQLDQKNCVLSFSSTLSMGTFAFELVLEDFPSTDIFLRYSDGSVSYKYRSMVRKSREVPKDSKYYWYSTDSYETSMVTDTAPTEGPSPESTAAYVTAPIETTSPDPTEAHPTTPDSRTWFPESTPEDTSANPTTSPPHSPTESTPEATTPHGTTQGDTTSPYPSETMQTTFYPHFTTWFPETTTEIQSTYAPASTEPPYTTEDHMWPTTQEDSSTVYPTDHPQTDYYTHESTPNPYDTDFTTQSTSEVTTTNTESYGTSTPTWEPSPSPPTYMYSLSKIPLQFILEVTGSVSSCVYGEYRPKFLSPTPNQGEVLRAMAGSPFQLHLSAEATRERIEDFKISGPAGISKKFSSGSATDIRSMVVEWTPEEDDIGDRVPFCFVAETYNGYQSELRCIIVIVGSSKLASLSCSENTMTLIIAKSPENGLYENNWRLDDSRCLVTSNSTHYIASVGYNSCGTKTEETENNIVFKNKVTSFDNPGEVITRKHQLAIPFNCSFPKKNRVSTSFRPQKAFYEFTEAGFGNFTYKFQFYTDEQFIDVETQYPLDVLLRDQLFMEIQVTSTVPNVQLFVESCRATPRDDPNDSVFYDVIRNGCTMDETVVMYPGSRTRVRFGMEAFAFIGSYEEVYMSCTVILCKLGEPDTRCAKGCIRPLAAVKAHRQRRNLATESQQHFISQGPLRLKKLSSSSRDSSASLNMNTVVVALSGVAIVALIALSVHIYVKKARMSNYKRLPTQDF
ncbi:hypothetical protein XENTR_v10010821 [Xenopus tropicalis]|uniref:Uncharacterized LOC116410289 n=1 Tax=Xenopus tropicalis TaxID=8364 RepID=A0A803JQU6_XENTR|nr:uncharacterized protein LOC116410289 [Xenopus tropicalis]KAE8606693.1 hypothetical protein XENTR_v10010821 [Xenopus tropicalis]